MKRRRILVVYAGFPTRATLSDGLYCFDRYSADEVFYLNLRFKGVPRYIWKLPFDLVIFHTLFFPSRHDPRAFNALVRKALPLSGCAGVKVMIPQDEFINAKGVNAFIRGFGIDVVFSAMPEREWPNIYDSIDRSRVRIYRVLPGYLDDGRLKRIEKFGKGKASRAIDIGYRTAGRPPAWFGRHGMLKQRIADVFADLGGKHGLKMDISTSAADTLLGDDWYRFLYRCKYALGVEGGTSVLDFDGGIKQRTEEYCNKYPAAGLEEVERACFPGLDGQFRGYAISPRHLEACATRTCQVLTEGEYNGVLVPGKHYIPVKRDFSNVNEVIEIVLRDRLREQITDRAYRDIVQSGKYSYREFVQFVISRSLDASGGHKKTAEPRGVSDVAAYYRGKVADGVDRLIGRLHRSVITPMRQRRIGGAEGDKSPCLMVNGRGD